MSFAPSSHKPLFGLAVAFGILLGVGILPATSYAVNESNGDGNTARVERETAPPVAPTAPATPALNSDGNIPATGLTPVKPDLSVPIPGITFSEAYNEGDYVVVPYLAQYISGLYRYMLGISTLVAIIVVVYGGFQYLLGSTVGSTKLGMTLIKDAIAGLVVLYTSYIILYTINPNLVNLQPIRLLRVNTVAIGEDIRADANPVESTSQCRLNYNQGRGDWARIPYGPSPQLFTSGWSNEDIGTFQQAGCGATALASVLAFYGLQISIAERVPGPGAARHLVDPIDTGINASVVQFDHVDSRGQHQMRYFRQNGAGTDSRIARYVERSFPQFEAHGIRASDKNAIFAALNEGHPLFISCGGGGRGVRLYSDMAATRPVMNNAGTSDELYKPGHYMVLSGVVSSDILAIHDVGNGSSKTIKYDEFVAHCGDATKITPKATYEETVTRTWGTSPRSVTVEMHLPANAAATAAAARGNGSCRQSGSSHSTPAGTAVATLPFNYLPAGQTIANWPADSARILYPERLRNVRDARVHVMIYLHGDNSGSDGNNSPEASYIPHLKGPLEQVAGAKDVVIFTPHHSAAGNAYPGFVLNTFYNEALTQLRTVMPGVTVIDTVVGGHSGATCKGGPTLRQAITGATPGLRGIIAYDGCAGGPLGDSQFLSPDNFSPPSGVALYINPDLSGMGHGSVPSATGGRTTRNLSVRSMWGNLSSQTCPVCARDQGSVACYAPNATYQRPGGGELISFETGAGHGGSVDVMTKIALCAFYANRSTAQQVTP